MLEPLYSSIPFFGFFWRLSLAKLPTDDKLVLRGLHLPCICSLCFNGEEDLAHVFFSCAYARAIWNWLHHMLELCLSIGCLEDYFLVIDRSAYAQCNLVSIAVVVSTVYAIWHAYNQAMFQNVSIPWKYACSSIVLMTTMALASKVFC